LQSFNCKPNYPKWQTLEDIRTANVIPILKFENLINPKDDDVILLQGIIERLHVFNNESVYYIYSYDCEKYGIKRAWGISQQDM